MPSFLSFKELDADLIVDDTENDLIIIKSSQIDQPNAC
jgi:hypothetical protein